jgi:hypothetical protein
MDITKIYEFMKDLDSKGYLLTPDGIYHKKDKYINSERYYPGGITCHTTAHIKIIEGLQKLMKENKIIPDKRKTTKYRQYTYGFKHLLERECEAYICVGDMIAIIVGMGIDYYWKPTARDIYIMLRVNPKTITRDNLIVWE